MAAACAIISSSIPNRPAVSTITTSKCLARASASPADATATGSPGPACGSACDSADAPGCGANTATPARSPTIRSWLTAPGRCRSQATNSGVWPWPRSHSASLPASVVLPEPCRPASITTVGGVFANASWRVCPPRMPISSSLTILTTCCAGLRAPDTSAPLARSLIRPTNALTTGSDTSASSSASRISRVVASTSASVSRPLPRSPSRAPVSRSDSDSNTSPSLVVLPRTRQPCPSRARRVATISPVVDDGPVLEVIDKGSVSEAHPVPLLFVHGGWHSASCWSNFLDFFADTGYRAVAVSLRGHGGSPTAKRFHACSIADYIDDVHATAERLGGRPVLIAHSLGGFVVQRYLETRYAPAAVLVASVP